MPAIVRSEATRHYGISIKRLEKTADTILKLCGQESSELSVLLVSDQAMQALNKQYRNKDKPTNVLSFPLRDADEAEDSLSPLGDIVISTDTAAAEALQYKTPLRARLNRLLVHGLIHLLGYDHERSDIEHTIMTDKENSLYDRLVQHERRQTMTHLAINVDHVATLRQARGINEPDPVLAAGICELAGASGIVVHLREDRRHIQDRDVYLYGKQ